MSPNADYGAPFAGLSPPYATIVVDPPWPQQDGFPRAPRYVTNGVVRSSGIHTHGASLPYSGLTLDQIRALPVTDLAADTRCYLWITNRHLRHAWSVLESWGFTPDGRVLVWCKEPRGTANVTTEFVLSGKHGKPPPLPSWTGTTWFSWPLQSEHSRKPAAFGDLVEAWSPGPYVELFARAPRLGWDHWGHGYEAARHE